MTEPAGREVVSQIAPIIRAIDICFLSTVNSDGHVHARPMSNNGEVEWDGDSWFFAPADGRAVSEISTNPAVVTAYRAEEGFKIVVVTGSASIENDPSLKQRYWLADLDRWFPNGPDDPNVVLIRVNAEHADWWTEEGSGSSDLTRTTAAS